MENHRRKTRVGIVFALPAEAEGLRHVLTESRVPARVDRDYTTWFAGGTETLVAVSGMGRTLCAYTTDTLIGAGAQVILCAGFAAGLDPAARVGDVLVGNRILLRDGLAPEPLRCTPGLVASLPPSGTLSFPIRYCDFATGDSIVCKASEKNEIHRQTGAAALDMECYAAGEVCSGKGVPFAVIKSVSDTADQDLPSYLGELLAIKGSLRRAAFVALRPSLWIDLERLRGQSHIASTNLGDVLGMMLVRLG